MSKEQLRQVCLTTYRDQERRARERGNFELAGDLQRWADRYEPALKTGGGSAA